MRVFHSAGDPTEEFSSLVLVHRVGRVMWWLTAGVRPVITQLRTGEVPAYFP